MEHGMNNFRNRTILPFIHTIMLRSVWYCCLRLNASLSTKGTEFIGLILDPIISPQYLDSLLGLIFDHGFEVTEPGQHFILLFQEVDLGVARVIIWRGEII